MVHLYVIPFPCSHIILFACQTFYHLTYNTFYMTALEHLDIPYILHHSRHVCLSFTLQSNNENSEKQWFRLDRLLFPTFKVVFLKQFINITLTVDDFTFYLDKGN